MMPFGGVQWPLFSLHFGSGEWLGVRVKSSDTFTKIISVHEKGISTIYADHFQALTDSRRQLTIILSLPLFGFVGVVLGLPPQMTPDEANLISLAATSSSRPSSCGSSSVEPTKSTVRSTGKLTDIEVKATRIERDLGDPARLLNDLAMDGLDLSAILDAPQSCCSVQTAKTAESSNEVMSNGEEQG